MGPSCGCVRAGGRALCLRVCVRVEGSASARGVGREEAAFGAPAPPPRSFFSLSLSTAAAAHAGGCPVPATFSTGLNAASLSTPSLPCTFMTPVRHGRVNGNACRSAGVAGGRTPCGSKCPKASTTTVFFFPSSPRTASAVPPRAALRHAPGRQRARVTGTGCTLTLGRESWGGVCVRGGGGARAGRERARRQTQK